MSWTWRCLVLRAVILVVVAVSVAVGQRTSVRGHRHRVSTRREVYHTRYRQRTQLHRPDQLVPEVINIEIEKEEQTSTYIY